MCVEFSIAKFRNGDANAKVEQRNQMVGPVSDVGVAFRQFFRPQVLALLALAVIWAGFVYGYKLSQYQQHPEVSRASLTRAWVDHRNDSLTVVSSELVRPQVRPSKSLGLALFSAAAPTLRIAHRSPDLVFDEPAPVREACLFSSLIPFRAPPFTNPSLA